MRTIALIGILLAAASCSPRHEEGKSGDRYQFIDGSKERVDFLFDRATGCIAEIRWLPDWARYPEFDPSKPFTTEDAPVQSSANASDRNSAAKPLQAKPDPKADDQVAAVSSFEPWQCPKPAPLAGEVIKK